jgi:hypothetical protein
MVSAVPAISRVTRPQRGHAAKVISLHPPPQLGSPSTSHQPRRRL